MTMKTAKKTERKPGRPALEAGNETIPVTIRMTASQKGKLAELGGPPWVRQKIDKAKLPNE